MDDNRLFKWIWRFNAILIAFCAVFAAGVIVWETALSSLFAPKRSVEVINIDQNDETVEETIELSISEPISGSQSFLIKAVKEQNYRTTGPSRKSTRDNTVNIAIHDPQSGATTWAFPTNAQLITTLTTLTPPTQPRVTLGFLITYVDKDSSGDNRLSNTDSKTLLALSTDATKRKTLLNTLKTNPTIFTSKTGTTTVFFTTMDGTFSALYSAQDQTLSSPKPVIRP